MQRFDDLNPARWRKNNPQAKGSMAVANRHNHVNGPSGAFFEDMNQAIMEGYNRSIMRLGREQRPDGSMFMNIANSEMTLALYASAFWRSFRNVIAVDPELVMLLEHTNADELPLDAIRYPFPLFYVAFPNANGLSLPGPDNEVDGVYIDTRMEGHLQLCITCRRTDKTLSKRNYPMVVERTFAISNPVLEGETLGGFVKRAIEEKIDDLIASSDVWNGLSEELRSGEFGRGAAKSVVTVAPKNNLGRIEDAEAGLPSALKALGLAMNVLSYLSTDHGRVNDFSPQPPQRLAKTLHNGTERQKRAAREEAGRLGILPIYVIGRGVLTDEERTALTDRTVKPHWRRGHIRRVWMDGGRERYEVRWIRPVIVNRHIGEPEGTHIHTIVTEAD
jgi:hypothetical protein